MSWVDIVLLVVALAAVFRALQERRHRVWAEEQKERELIIQRERHEAVLVAETARSAAVFDRMLEGVMVIGGDGRIRFANRAAGELFEAAGPLEGLTPLEATRRHEVAAALRRLEKENEILDEEVRIDRSAGPRLVQLNAMAMLAGEGRREGALLVFHDVTRLRQLESVRQDFVANVSHELRTPLSLIKGAAETLIDGAKSEPVMLERFLDIIDRNSNRLTLLIDDLLLLARLDSGRLEMKLQPVDLHATLTEVLTDAAQPARLRCVRISNEIPGGLRAHADPHRLRQVLANLVDNAIKYGRVEGMVSVSGEIRPDGMIQVRVRDDGPGIPEEARGRVFERFYRVDRARAREQGGTGLGLAIVKNVVEAHGGTVRVESAPGQGTDFYFTLRSAA